MRQHLPDLPADAFEKVDPTDDLAFYAPARLVTHIDETATATLTGFYRAMLTPGGTILDLMSSWVSHLPPELALAGVIGHGMNAEELAANPRLTRRFVRDLNREPVLPLDAATCDAALCCVGVQYLQHPGRGVRGGRPRPAAGCPVHRQLLEPLFPDQGRRHLAGTGCRRTGPARRPISGTRRLRRHRDP